MIRFVLPSRETVDLDLDMLRSGGGDLGARIEERRDALGLTRQDLARKLGTTVTWIVDLERSTFRWKNKSLIRVAAALDLPQLEVAIAAGVITDLPHYPQPVVPSDGTTRADQIEVRRMLGWESAEIESARIEIEVLLRSFSLDELRFVLAIMTQMVNRRS